jgi:hypothetical protein
VLLDGVRIWIDGCSLSWRAYRNRAYNGHRQRVLKGHLPDKVLRERLKAKPELAKLVTKPPDPDALPKALKDVDAAKEVSHPDTETTVPQSW